MLMRLKRLAILCASFVLVCSSAFIIPVHAEGGLPDDCNGDRYCEFLKNVRNSGKITKESAEDVFQNATDSDLYRFGSFLNAPLFDLADEPSIARNAWTKKWRDYFNQIKNGYLDTRYGTGFNFRGCLLFGGKYCEIPKNDPDYIYFSNPSGGTGSGGGGSGGSGGGSNYRNTWVNNSYRNYYIGGKKVDNTYYVNSGDTHNYSIVNNTFNEHKITYYKTENNTYNTYNTNNYYQTTYKDYYYDITNNYFNYTLEDNSTMQISYDLSNTTVNIIGSAGTTSYKYYYELPNGLNSFNLTEDQIKGYVLDYHVQNYKNISDGSNVLGLYHFDGDASNVANNQFKVSISPSTVNYINDGVSHFDSALVWSPTSSQVHNLTFNSKGVEFYDFRFKPIIDNQNDFIFYINGNEIFKRHPYVETEVSYTTEKKQTTSTIENFVKSVYTFMYFYKDTSKYAGSYPFDETLSDAKVQSRASEKCNNYDKKYRGKVTKIENSTVANDHITKKVYCDLFTTQTVTQEVEVQVPHTTKTTKYTDNEHFSKLQAGTWNHLALKKVTDHFNVYLNGLYLMDIPLGGDSINISVLTSSPLSIDELRILGSCSYVDRIGDSFTPSVMPYDSDLTYVLPDVEYNHTILIQSTLPVTTTQFGGKRLALPTVGAVYTSVENDVITSVQQYNGADWMSVPASVFSSDTSKWVSIIGQSIIDGIVSSGSSSGLSGGSGGGSGASEGFLSKKFSEVIEAIKGIKIINNDNYSETVNNNFTLDFDTTNNSYKSIENKIKENNIYSYKERQHNIISALQGTVTKAQTAEPIITIPEIKLDETVLIPATSFNVATVFAVDSMSRLLTILHTIIRAWVYISVSLLWYRKLLGFFRK